MTPRRRSPPLPAVTVSWLSPGDVSDLLGVSQRTLREWRYFRTGPAFVVLGGRIRYRSDDLDRWVNAQRVETDTPSA